MSESNEELKNKISELERSLKRYMLENELLQAEIRQLKRDRFGSKSERFTDEGFEQLSLFDDLDEEPVEAPTEDGDEASNVVEIAAHKRNLKKKKSFSDSLPRREVIIPVPESEKVREISEINLSTPAERFMMLPIEKRDSEHETDDYPWFRASAPAVPAGPSRF